MPAICALIKRTSAKTVTFAMCAFGAPWQKATTLLYTAGFDAWLDVLRERAFSKSSDEINAKYLLAPVAGYTDDGDIRGERVVFWRAVCA